MAMSLGLVSKPGLSLLTRSHGQVSTEIASQRALTGAIARVRRKAWPRRRWLNVSATALLPSSRRKRPRRYLCIAAGLVDASSEALCNNLRAVGAGEASSHIAGRRDDSPGYQYVR
jgi:hypothetical protein